MKKVLRIERILWLSFVLIVLGFTFYKNSGLGLAKEEDSKEQDRYFSLLGEALEYVREYYVDEDPVSYQNLIYGAIEGMLGSLGDEHSGFLSQENYKELRDSLKNTFGGLGIYISIRDEYPYVVSPIEDTPAFRMGIQAGDRIVEIEGEDSLGWKIDEVVRRLKGKPGTQVSIKVARETLLEPLPVTLTREIIKVPTVKYGMITPGRAYIRIASFGQKTVGDLQKAIIEMIVQGMDQLVLDLRNNPGGLLSSAVKVSDMFLSDGKIVYTQGRNEEAAEIFYSNKGNTLLDEDIPLVVLVNEGSASASEILAGALQDTLRGFLVGTQTFGKGSVQTIIPLRESQESIAMRLTVQKYFTPAGRSIHGEGITPDLEVSIPKKEFEEIYMEKKLQDGKYVKTFIRSHPQYKDRDIESFRKDLEAKEIRIPIAVLRSYIHREAQKGIPLFDLDNDIQLQKAVELLEKKEKKLKRTVKSFR